MPVIRTADAAPFETHGSRFISYVAPSRGSSLLCCWRLEVPAGLECVAHRPNLEEVVLVLDGQLDVTALVSPDEFRHRPGSLPGCLAAARNRIGGDMR